MAQQFGGIDYKVYEVIKLTSFKDKNVFSDLFQLYLRDLSKYNPNLVIDKNGLYPASWIHNDWDLSEFLPLQIEQNQILCGFVLLTKSPLSKPGTEFFIQDFFILKEFRYKKIGFASIEQLFRKFSGSYSLVVIKDNLPAVLFWEKILELLGFQFRKEPYTEEGVEGFNYEFTTT